MYYNTKRRHLSLNYESPGQAHLNFIPQINFANSHSIYLPSKAIVKITYKNLSHKTANDYFSVTPHLSTYGFEGISVNHIKSVNAHNYSFQASEPAFEKYELAGKIAGDQYTLFNILIKKNE